MYRIVRGLKWARACSRPSSIPQSRARGAKRKGLNYEAALAAHLTFASRGRWFEFEDRNGHGWCQVDLMCDMPLGPALVSGERQILVLEAKYSWVPEAHSQIDCLYRPVVEMALGARVRGIVVCKNLSDEIPPQTLITGNWEEAVMASLSWKNVVWQWLGTQIRTNSRARKRVASVPRSSQIGL